MSDCNCFIADDVVFPRRPSNRPALPRIGYRVATYAEFVEAMVRSIDTAVELRAWTHRASDDPGIALLEGAAVVGDILTFYQERYANEAFLRTATWRDSIAALVRLLGYRLAPGVGGHATFAFEVKKQIDLPAKLPLRADVEGSDSTVDFQTSDALTAYPQLSRFNLYRPRLYGSSLSAGSTRLELQSVDGSARSAAIDAVALKKGDRLLLLPAEPAWTTSTTSFSAAQQTPQVVKLKAVTRQLGRTILELEAGLLDDWTLPVTAYRLGRSWRHFGHNAPRTVIENTPSTGTITGATQRDTAFTRHVRANHDCSNSDCTIEIPGEMIPLDQAVNDLTAGARIVVRTIVQDGSGASLPLAVLKSIVDLREATIGFAALNGPSTLLTMDSALDQSTTWLSSDVRDYHVDEVTSPALALQPLATFGSGALASGADALCFYGTLDEVTPLASRRLLLAGGGGDPVALTCTSDTSTFTPAAGMEDEAAFWTLSFDTAPDPFALDDFDEAKPTVTVFGNLADATQGKGEAEVPLGNGDARSRFQTFKVPKAPLTYLLSSGATPPQEPELQVRVNGREWTRVDSLFGRAPDEQVYVVREDADGASYVQFGDGESGSRLPSGIQNVTAAYRTGDGAHGPLKAGASPAVGQRIDGLDKVQLPGIVSGGAAPEVGDDAREAAPGRIQSLGRLVSLRDFETETLTIPGVTTATAAWGLVDAVPALTLAVLLEGGREAEFDSVRATLQSYQHCRGPDRFAVVVQQAFLRYVYVDLQYAFDPTLEQSDIEGAIRSALGLVGDDASARTGLFGLRARRLGAPEYATHVEGIVQQVAGVSWCRVTALGLFAAGITDPASTALPAAPRARDEVLTPASTELLQLHRSHLTLASAPAPAAQECA